MKLGQGHIEENISGELENGEGNGYDQNMFSMSKLKLLYSEKLGRPLFWMESEQTRPSLMINIHNQISLGAQMDTQIEEFFLKIEDSRLPESV